jgi:hypothetical protein
MKDDHKQPDNSIDASMIRAVGVLLSLKSRRCTRKGTCSRMSGCCQPMAISAALQFGVTSSLFQSDIKAIADIWRTLLLSPG